MRGGVALAQMPRRGDRVTGSGAAQPGGKKDQGMEDQGMEERGGPSKRRTERKGPETHDLATKAGKGGKRKRMEKVGQKDEEEVEEDKKKKKEAVNKKSIRRSGVTSDKKAVEASIKKSPSPRQGDEVELEEEGGVEDFNSSLDSQSIPQSLHRMLALRHHKYVGCHVSASGGVHNAIGQCRQVDGMAFACFLKNQRQWNYTKLTTEVALKFKQQAKEILDYELYGGKGGRLHDGKKETAGENGRKYGYVLPHGSYLINLANPDKDKNKRLLIPLWMTCSGVRC